VRPPGSYVPGKFGSHRHSCRRFGANQGDPFLINANGLHSPRGLHNSRQPLFALHMSKVRDPRPHYGEYCALCSGGFRSCERFARGHSDEIPFIFFFWLKKSLFLRIFSLFWGSDALECLQHSRFLFLSGYALALWRSEKSKIISPPVKFPVSWEFAWRLVFAIPLRRYHQSLTWNSADKILAYGFDTDCRKCIALRRLFGFLMRVLRSLADR